MVGIVSELTGVRDLLLDTLCPCGVIAVNILSDGAAATGLALWLRSRHPWTNGRRCPNRRKSSLLSIEFISDR